MRRLPLTRRSAPTSPRKRGEVNRQRFPELLTKRAVVSRWFNFVSFFDAKFT
jgi:hypothetical protein